ncbi:MAG: hypothetical protein HYY93_05505 [Planctomycetes bacterium]|nr:hypothetical protein [Planctomycetota bacterium]
MSDATAAPAAISPNGDGALDAATISAAIRIAGKWGLAADSEKALAESRRTPFFLDIAVVVSQSTTIRVLARRLPVSPVLRPKGTPAGEFFLSVPFSLEWDGTMTDGAVAPDALYTLSISAVLRRGSNGSGAGEQVLAVSNTETAGVTVDTRPPRIVFTPANGEAAAAAIGFFVRVEVIDEISAVHESGAVLRVNGIDRTALFQRGSPIFTFTPTPDELGGLILGANLIEVAVSDVVGNSTSDSASFTLTPPPEGTPSLFPPTGGAAIVLEIVSGDGQGGPSRRPARDDFVVRVRRGSRAVPRARVAFSATGGNGVVERTPARSWVTDAHGEAGGRFTPFDVRFDPDTFELQDTEIVASLPDDPEVPPVRFTYTVTPLRVVGATPFFGRTPCGDRVFPGAIIPIRSLEMVKNSAVGLDTLFFAEERVQTTAGVRTSEIRPMEGLEMAAEIGTFGEAGGPFTADPEAATFLPRRARTGPDGRVRFYAVARKAGDFAIRLVPAGFGFADRYFGFCAQADFKVWFDGQDTAPLAPLIVGGNGQVGLAGTPLARPLQVDAASAFGMFAVLVAARSAPNAEYALVQSRVRFTGRDGSEDVVRIGVGLAEMTHTPLGPGPALIRSVVLEGTVRLTVTNPETGEVSTYEWDEVFVDRDNDFAFGPPEVDILAASTLTPSAPRSTDANRVDRESPPSGAQFIVEARLPEGLSGPSCLISAMGIGYAVHADTEIPFPTRGLSLGDADGGFYRSDILVGLREPRPWRRGSGESSGGGGGEAPEPLPDELPDNVVRVGDVLRMEVSLGAGGPVVARSENGAGALIEPPYAPFQYDTEEGVKKEWYVSNRLLICAGDPPPRFIVYLPEGPRYRTQLFSGDRDMNRFLGGPPYENVPIGTFEPVPPAAGGGGDLGWPSNADFGSRFLSKAASEVPEGLGFSRGMVQYVPPAGLTEFQELVIWNQDYKAEEYDDESAVAQDEFAVRTKFRVVRMGPARKKVKVRFVFCGDPNETPITDPTGTKRQVLLFEDEREQTVVLKRAQSIWDQACLALELAEPAPTEARELVNEAIGGEQGAGFNMSSYEQFAFAGGRDGGAVVTVFVVNALFFWDNGARLPDAGLSQPFVGTGHLGGMLFVKRQATQADSNITRVEANHTEGVILAHELGHLLSHAADLYRANGQDVPPDKDGGDMIDGSEIPNIRRLMWKLNGQRGYYIPLGQSEEAGGSPYVNGGTDGGENGDGGGPPPGPPSPLRE